MRLDRRDAVHHHRFMVIGGVTLEMGSFNETQGKPKNLDSAKVKIQEPDEVDFSTNVVLS